MHADSTYQGLQLALPSGGFVQNSAFAAICRTASGACKHTVDPILHDTVWTRQPPIHTLIELTYPM